MENISLFSGSTQCELSWLYQEEKVPDYEIVILMQNNEVGGQQLEETFSGFALKITNLNPTFTYDFR